MRWIVITFVFLTSVCCAQHCPDPRLREAAIGGDTVDGGVRLHNKPLKFAQLRLFFSDGKTARVGTTDRNGRFHVSRLQPDTYRLDVGGWGITTIRISPDLSKLPNGQTVFYSLTLMDNQCIGTTSVTN